LQGDARLLRPLLRPRAQTSQRNDPILISVGAIRRMRQSNC
jgi:hypothetical protein